MLDSRTIFLTAVLIGLSFCVVTRGTEYLSIKAVLSMSPSEIEQHPPVLVRGVIIALGEGIATPSPKFGSLVLDDETGGIWVNINRAEQSALLETQRAALDRLEIGMEVEVTGRIARGAYAPVIIPISVSMTGRRHTLQAKVASLEQFLRGDDFLRLVEVQGVVQRVTEEANYGWLLQIETGLGYFLCRLPKREPYSPETLVDARLSVSGVAAASRNWRKEFVCPRLIVNHDSAVRILREPDDDPYQAKLVELTRLNAFSIEGTSLHRIRVQGIVTFADNLGDVFIQEKDFAVRVKSHDSPLLMPGDFIEAIGFVDSSGNVAQLNGAKIRVIGRRPIPAPVNLKFADILKSNEQLRLGIKTEVPGYDGIYAELTGTVLGHSFEVDRSRSYLQIDCSDAVSTITIVGRANPIAPGSVVSARGVVDLQYEGSLETSYYTPPSKLNLIVSGNAQINLLYGPPWWTVKRLLTALVGVVCFSSAVLIWIFSLKRTLKRKTQEIALEINLRHDAALEFQAALKERTRLAANLHDTLLQTLAGANYQLEACMRQLPESSSKQSLTTAQRIIQRGQSEIRGAVWTLRALPHIKRPFEESVHQVVKQSCADRACDISVAVELQYDHLADFVAGNLLLVIQESVINALRHANPSKIFIEVRTLPVDGNIQVRIQDDGQGFQVGEQANVTEGHFGIQGMKERVERLGGQFRIESQTQQGSTVIAVVPLSEFDELLDEL
jgi:signal transduction histidine kinase